MQTAIRRVSGQARGPAPYLGVLALRVNPDTRMDFQAIELEPLVLARVLHTSFQKVRLCSSSI